MDVNKIKIVSSPGEKSITFPLSENWDLLNRGDSISVEETKIIYGIIGKPLNYELVRYSMRPLPLGSEFGDGFCQYTDASGNLITPPGTPFILSLTINGENIIINFSVVNPTLGPQGPNNTYVYLGYSQSTGLNYDLIFNLPNPNYGPNYAQGWWSIEGNFDNTSEVISTNLFDPPQGSWIQVQTGNITNNLLSDTISTPCSQQTNSKLIHNFNFLISENTWTTSYPPTFERAEIKYLAKSFFKSFFKLDFYDSIDQLAQKIYFTIILPASSGILGNEDGVDLTIPIFELDHVGTQEGYYIYWYEDKSLFNITEMYFKAKFFNGKLGEFFQFSNVTPNDILPKSINSNNLYYKVVFDYNNFEYIIKDLSDNTITNLNWYQII
jgi:hypothetical protein